MRADRGVGLLLLLTALFTVISLVFRLMADADQATVQESAYAIADSRGYYALGGLGRTLAGLLLWAVGKQLRHTIFPTFNRSATDAVALLFTLSGIATAASGIFALILSGMAEGPLPPQDDMSDGVYMGPLVGAIAESMFPFRSAAGALGFTLAGLALVALALVQWRMGRLLRITAIFGVVLGVTMLFIWVDATFVVHRIIEFAFITWLIAAGLWLFVPSPRSTRSAHHGG